MRLLTLLTVLSGPLLSTAKPRHNLKSLATWEVEGFARDNPLGPTTGGQSGTTVTVSTAADLRAAVTGNDAKIVLINGNITLPSRLRVGSNKSLIGVNSTAHITGSGIDVVDATNVVIRNIKISFILNNDCITIRNSTRVWVDHNEFTSGGVTNPDTYVGCPFFLLFPSTRTKHPHLLPLWETVGEICDVIRTRYHMERKGGGQSPDAGKGEVAFCQNMGHGAKSGPGPATNSLKADIKSSTRTAKSTSSAAPTGSRSPGTISMITGSRP